MSSYSNKYNNQKKSKFAKFLCDNYPILLLIAALFIPLITRLYQYDPKLNQFSWFPLDAVLDVFLYWKSVALTVLGSVIAVIIAIKLTSKKNRAEYKKTIWLYFLLGYAVLTLLSTLFSKYRDFGFTGIYEQFEPLWAILAYCLITFFAYMFIRKDSDLTMIRCALAVLLVILCALGISQLIGHDFFESELGRKLIVPDSLAEQRDALNFHFSNSGNHQVYLTLYNPNYVGMFASLILPITTILFFGSKGWWRRVIWGVLSLVLLVCTFGSGSKSFMISIVISMVIAAVFSRKILLKRWFVVIPALVVVLFVGKSYFNRMNINPFQYVKNALTLNETIFGFEDIRFYDTHISIFMEGEELRAMYFLEGDNLFLVCMDSDGVSVEYTMREDGVFVTSDPRFSRISFRFFSGNGKYPYIAAVYPDGKLIYFVSTENGYQYYTYAGKVGVPDYPESAIFTNYGRFASGRGYLWSRSIPLLKKYFILGSGADTFSIAFPQNDVVGKTNYGYNYSYITKPHCLYLQIGVQHGVLGLICFLAVCIIYIVQSFRLYWRGTFTDSRQWFGLGIMLGIIGYLISGISNDSTITVAPLFWALLGIGFAVNRMNQQDIAVKTATISTESEKSSGKKKRKG